MVGMWLIMGEDCSTYGIRYMGGGSGGRYCSRDDGGGNWMLAGMLF